MFEVSDSNGKKSYVMGGIAKAMFRKVGDFRNLDKGHPERPGKRFSSTIASFSSLIGELSESLRRHFAEARLRTEEP